MTNTAWELFHFLRPWLLAGLVIPAVLYLLLRQKAASAGSWEKACDKNLLRFLLVKTDSPAWKN